MKKTWTCEWRAPVQYPLQALLDNLTLSIDRTARHIQLHRASRVYAWRKAIAVLQKENRRTIAERIARAIQENARSSTKAPNEPNSDVWRFPYQDAFRSLLEARMFIHIVQHLEHKLRPEHWRAIIGGNLRPENDNQHTPHRDYLLELYVGSAAEAAGMSVELAEPDIIAHIGGRHIGIAAKRIKSRKQIFPNAKKGAAQIMGSATDRGIVFLDVSELLNQHTAALRYLRNVGVKIEGTVHGHLLKFVSEASEIQRLLDEPHVEGIILRHAVPVIFAKSFIPGTLETWTPVVENPSALTTAVYGRFLDALSPQESVGLPGLPPGTTPSEFSFVHI